MKPILLETKRRTKLLREKGSLVKCEHSHRIQIGDVFQHIYLIDETAEIKEGDVFLNTRNNSILKCEKLPDDSTGFYNEDKSAFLWIQEWHKKIVVSTDPSLVFDNKFTHSIQGVEMLSSHNKSLPLLSEQSVKLLIDYYNREGKMPESVEIETDDEPVTDGDWEKYSTIKLNSKGEVDLLIPEEKMYTKDEVIELCKSAFITGSRLNDLVFDDWIKENLK